MSLFNKPTRRKPGFKLALVATIFALAVAMLGTYTRWAEADYGCPEWPGCYGQLPFLSDIGGEGALGGYVGGFPKYDLDEGGLWADLAHRYIAFILGLMIIALAVNSWFRREDDDYPFRLPTFILFLVVWQALLGLWAAELVLWPQVTTIHLVMGIITCALLWLLALRLDNKRWKIEVETKRRLDKTKPWLLVGIVLVVAQIMLGGWMTANHATTACPDFPSCQNQWWPEMDIKQGFNITDSFGLESLVQAKDSKSRVAIHMANRLAAVVACLYLLGLIVFMLTIKHRGSRRISLIIAAMLGLHAYLVVGVAQLQSSLVNVLIHNMSGALLLLTLVMLANKVWAAKPKYERPNH